MKFLVDAEMPARLTVLLLDRGHDALHTSGLQDGNRTTDQEIAALLPVRPQLRPVDALHPGDEDDQP